MDVKQLLDWCKLPVVLLGAMGAIALAIDARAQSAAESKAEAVATQQVEQRMVPIEQQLETLVQQGEEQALRERVREDREAMAWCLDREHQDLSADARARVCEAESEARWETWAEQDRKKEKPPE